MLYIPDRMPVVTVISQITVSGASICSSPGLMDRAALSNLSRKQSQPHQRASAWKTGSLLVNVHTGTTCESLLARIYNLTDNDEDNYGSARMEW
jgi:hypothetical protein